jgi:hypothetical protein
LPQHFAVEAFRGTHAMPQSVNDHPFYRPLWRRMLIVLATVIWAGFEVLVTQSGMFTVLSVAIMAYAIWAFLIVYKPAEK